MMTDETMVNRARIRGADAIGIFPNGSAITRLTGAMLPE